MNTSRASTQGTKDKWIAFMQKGTRHYQSGQFPDATIAFSQAIRILPSQPEGWVNLGAALAQLDQHSKAVSAIESAIRLNPNLMPLGFNS
ncbi:MAG: hypothetical protein DSZ00_07710 [Gammaproteobacteria bacterium]|nr:MAG: hypothetical protein DSZ00_07710 [Gammaproteobacteria bacterium]RTZ73304.1 MAG: hypothetical protein DSZ02_07465 [Gammaproteobacteria bacterium]